MAIAAMVNAQIKPLSTLPAYDCGLKKVMQMLSRPMLIVSPDNSTGLETMLNDYCATFGNNCVRKKESELIAGDFEKDILIVGVLPGIRKWKSYNTPITALHKGFLINGQSFTDTLDGFVYVDTNRIIVSGNSLQAVKDAQLALTGGHDIMILQKGKITFFGNKTGHRFAWYNLQNLKLSNYNKKASNLFSAVYISKTFKDSIDYKAINTALQVYAKQFLSVYDIAMPSKKVSWFLHSNIMEFGTMSGMFGLTCPGNNSGGFSIRGEIHTNGFNIPLLKHEYSHFLFDSNIPQDNNPAFFVEGCVEYVTDLNDSNVLKERIAIAKKFKDTVNYRDLIINNKEFYGQYSSSNYSICGIFVKFLIDNFGVASFKKYCLAPNKNVATKEIFSKDFDELVELYKSWLDKQS